MQFKTSVSILAIGLGVAIFVSILQTSPGYMDAEYYYANGIQLVDGKGLYEPFLWNYLDNPVGLPHPSFAYWMPLPSLLAAMGMILTGTTTFFSARLITILAAAILPLFVYQLSKKINQNEKLAWMSGFVAIFSGYYVIYITNTDSFTILMLIASSFYLVAFSAKIFSTSERNKIFGYIALGILAGLMHLARADGLLWLAVCPGILLWRLIGEYKQIESKAGSRIILKYILFGLLMLSGYGVVTFWWYGRNLSTWGSLLPPGGSLTLWLTNYNQTFAYPSNLLTVDSWIASGWRAIINIRLDAVVQNLKTLLGVQLQVFMLPFVILAAWKLKRNPVFLFGFLMWLIIFIVMSFVFPFAGARGGYLHSGASIQPLIWALFPTGFSMFLQWGDRVRKWNPTQSTRFFTIGFLILSAVMTGILLQQNLLEKKNSASYFNEKSQYAQIGTELDALNIERDDIVLVNNPPGFYLATGRKSIVIPDGNVDTLIMAARKYKATIVVLENDHPEGLNTLYDSPEIFSSLQLLYTSHDVHIIRIPGAAR